MVMDPRRASLGLLAPLEMESRGLTSRERDLFQALITTNRLLLIIALGQKSVAGRFTSSMLGSSIGSTDRFISLVENLQNYPIGVVIGTNFTGVPGQQVKLSLSESQSSGEVVDYLGNTASAPSFNKRISEVIILAPHQKLWINTADTGVAINAATLFSVRILDIGALIAESAWETRS